MMFLKRIKVLILLLIVLLDAKSQTNIDSLAINFLVKNNQIKDSDIVYKKRVVKGKIITNQNIYIDKVFCLKENEETLNIYGFGTYSSESNRCMLFEYGYNSTNKYFFLGLWR